MNSRELVLVLGMVTVLVFCREGQSVFPVFAALETNPDFGCMLGHVLLVRKIPVCW